MSAAFSFGFFPCPDLSLYLTMTTTAMATTITTMTMTHMMYSSPSNSASSLVGEGQPCFTLYDFWCSGVSPDVLQPVKESPDMWLALVDEPDSLKKFYSGAPDLDVLRSQLPGATFNTAQFNSLCGITPRNGSGRLSGSL